MSKNLKEFCTGKKIKSFLCGDEAREGSSCLGNLLKAYCIYKAVSIAAGLTFSPEAAINGETEQSLLEGACRKHYVTAENDTLLSYNYNGSQRREERLQNLIGTVMQTPTGKKVLQEMADKNCVLMFEGIGFSTAGFFQPDCNAICLNSWMPDEDLASTLVHEGTHALQYHRSGYGLSVLYDKASLFTIGRTMEADAVRAQAAFAFEAAEIGFSAPWNALEKRHPKITQTYRKCVKDFGKDSPETAKRTMKAWFKETDYAKMYERQYAKAVKEWVGKADSAELSVLFSISVPTDSIVSKLCQTENGVRYCGTNGKEIETADTYYIHSSVKKDLDKADRKFKEVTSEKLGIEKSDASHAAFYVLNRDGTISSPSLKKQAQNKTIHFYDALKNSR